MGELREIVEAQTVERWFAVLAIVGPILGLLIGATVGARRGAGKAGAVSGLLVGLLGTLNWLCWRLYNALTDANGLDTVKNVVINGVVFVAIGAVIGSVTGYLRRRTIASPEGDFSALAGAERSFEAADTATQDG